MPDLGVGLLQNAFSGKNDSTGVFPILVGILVKWPLWKQLI